MCPNRVHFRPTRANSGALRRTMVRRARPCAVRPCGHFRDPGPKPENPGVGGSIPSLPTIPFQVVARRSLPSRASAPISCPSRGHSGARSGALHPDSAQPASPRVRRVPALRDRRGVHFAPGRALPEGDRPALAVEEIKGPRCRAPTGFRRPYGDACRSSASARPREPVARTSRSPRPLRSRA